MHLRFASSFSAAIASSQYLSNVSNYAAYLSDSDPIALANVPKLVLYINGSINGFPIRIPLIGRLGLYFINSYANKGANFPAYDAPAKITPLS